MFFAVQEHRHPAYRVFAWGFALGFISTLMTANQNMMKRLDSAPEFVMGLGLIGLATLTQRPGTVLAGCIAGIVSALAAGFWPICNLSLVGPRFCHLNLVRPR